MKIRASFALLAVVIIAGCEARQNSLGVLPNQSSFLLRFGVSDTTPADWSGSVETTGGRITSLSPWHFDKEDRLGPKPNSWSCTTRFAAVLHGCVNAHLVMLRIITDPEPTLRRIGCQGSEATSISNRSKDS